MHDDPILKLEQNLAGAIETFAQELHIAIRDAVMVEKVRVYELAQTLSTGEEPLDEDRIARSVVERICGKKRGETTE